MNTTLITLLASLIILAIVFAGFAIRVFLIKDGTFRGSCAGNNPMLKDEIGPCTVCGAKADEACKGDLPELKA